VARTKQSPGNGQLFKSVDGTVRPYTRHLSICKFADNPQHNACSCPKWLYEHRKGFPRKRFSLNTPSYAEAVIRAGEELQGFNPEIAKSRAENAKKESNTKTIEEAIKLWLDRTKNMFGDDAGILAQYRSTFGWRDSAGEAHGNLLTYIESYNRRYPKAPVQFIQDITPLIAQQWYDSWNGRYSDDTRKQRWGTVRSFFAFLQRLDALEENPVANIKAVRARQVFANVPYTEDQYKRILDEADWYVDERVKDGEREVYCRRSRLFLQLLRNTGMDIGDAVMFKPSMITDEVIDGKTVQVLRYHRAKTGVEAIVVIDRVFAARLRNIPAGPSALEDRPFRYRGNLAQSDAHNWSRRIAKLIALAKIGGVQLMKRDGTPALDAHGKPLTHRGNVKMLRHTFAVGELLKGRKPEVVAKQLGHVDTNMVFRHYAPWCKERDIAHIKEQLA
jgi:integrase